MKDIYPRITVPGLLLYWLAAFCLVSCGGRQDSRQEGSGTLQKTELPEDLATSQEYGLWGLVVGEYRDGMFRGVSFDDTRQKVGITETFEIFEDLPAHILYTHDTRDLETIDVYYHFSDEQLVNKIVIDVFLNSTSSAERLWKIAGWYFDNRYGVAPEAGEVRKVWVNAGVKTVLENVSKGIDYGLKITFTPSDREALAQGPAREPRCGGRKVKGRV